MVALEVLLGFPHLLLVAGLASPLTMLVLSIIRLVTIVRRVGVTVVILRPTRQFPALSCTVRLTQVRLENAARNRTCVVGLPARTLCVVLSLPTLGTRTLTSRTLGRPLGDLKHS